MSYVWVFIRVPFVAFFLDITKTFKLFLAVWLAKQQSYLRSDEFRFETRSLLTNTQNILNTMIRNKHDRKGTKFMLVQHRVITGILAVLEKYTLK